MRKKTCKLKEDPGFCYKSKCTIRIVDIYNFAFFFVMMHGSNIFEPGFHYDINTTFPKQNVSPVAYFTGGYFTKVVYNVWNNLNAKPSLSIFVLLYLWYISDLPKVKIEQ